MPVLIRVFAVAAILASTALAVPASNATHLHRARAPDNAKLIAAYPAGLSPTFEGDLEVQFGRSYTPDDSKKAADASCKESATAKCSTLGGAIRIFGVGCAVPSWSS